MQEYNILTRLSLAVFTSGCKIEIIHNIKISYT